MNILQLLIELIGAYTADEIASMLVLKFKQVTGNSIAHATIKRYLQQPISEYKEFSENFNDILCAVANTDIRVAIELKLKETELV